jgi:hypothetical protein
MKTLITSALAILVAFASQSQSKEEPLLTAYYAVKDALVQGDEKAASTQAGELVKQLDAFSAPQLDKNTQQLKEKIKSDAAKIAASTALASQRETFSPLSTNFFEFAKAVELSTAPVYQFYCPMKKAIWLSSENSVKNPYYGKQMLTCGSLKETLK